MDWVKIAKADELSNSGIPLIPCGSKHMWVRKEDIDKIAEIIGKRPRQAQYSYSSFEGVQTFPGAPVMTTVFVAKEILDLFGLKHVYVKHGDDQVRSEIIASDPRNLFIFTNCVPNMAESSAEPIDVICIDNINMLVPDEIRVTFKKSLNDPKAHEIKDDNGNLIAYVKDNKVWITFDIGAVEGRREKGWLPSVLLHSILRRALPLGYSNEEVKGRTEEERVKELEKAADEWVKIWTQDSGHRLRNLKQQYESASMNMRDYMTQIAEISRRMEHLSEQIRVEEEADNTEEIAKREFAQILTDIPELESIQFDNKTIVFRTSMIQIQEDASRDPIEFEPFDLGEFEIRCSAGSPPTITNLTKQIKYNGHVWHHPHVQDGYTCFGNISSRVSELSGQRKWRDVVMLTIEYLKNVTARDDQWGRAGFGKFQESAKKIAECVEHKEEMLEPVKVWSEFKPEFRVFNLQPGDKVCAVCPDICGLKDKKDDDGNPLCSLQGEGSREGTVKTMMDHLVQVEWKITNDEGEEHEVNCMGFTYDNISRTDGKPLFEGDNNIYVSEKKRRELGAIIDTLDAVEIRIEAEESQYLPDPATGANCESPDITLDELNRTKEALTVLFEDGGSNEE